jgi:hypothetical protein
MAKYYTEEKAKYGGVTGTIQPFTIQLPDVNIPSEAGWKQYLPAGYLRCDGSILNKDQYPALAAILGVGKNSKFAKDPTILDGDQFQLPDLGSKYIRCSNSTGQYLNTTLDQDNTIARVGAETKVQSLVGDTTTIRYGGYFEVIGQINDFGGNPLYKTSTGYTLNSSLTEEAFQAHGHSADVGVFTYLGKWQDSAFIQFTGSGRGGNDGQTEGSNNTVTIDGPEGSSYNVSHNHQVDLPSSIELKSNSTLKYQFVNTIVPADGLESTVVITTEDVKKLDTAISPYILVEYIIKI